LKQLKNPFDGSYAIIIGIENYDHFPRLDVAREDIEKMKSFLLSTGEYDEVVVLQDEEATFSNIHYFMQEYFPQKMEKGRYRFLFYFSGHGTQHSGSNNTFIGSLLLKEATGSLGDQHVIDMKEIDLWAVRLVNAKHTLFLIDSCFSGLAGIQLKSVTDLKSYFTTFEPKDLAKENGQFLITAGGIDEQSIADIKTWGGSLFTDVLISGMSGKGDSDPNKDGLVTTYELFNYVHSAVKKEAQRAHHSQTPLLSQLGTPYKDKGQYFFVYNG